MSSVSGDKPYVEPVTHEKRITRSQAKKQAQTKKVHEAAQAKKTETGHKKSGKIAKTKVKTEVQPSKGDNLFSVKKPIASPHDVALEITTGKRGLSSVMRDQAIDHLEVVKVLPVNFKKALRSLNLDGAKIAQNKFAEVISHFPHITSLSLKDCDLDDDLCRQIVRNARKALQDTQELFLGNNPHISGRGLLEFLKVIPPHKINVGGSTSIRVEDINEDLLSVIMQQQVLAHKVLQDISTYLKDDAWEERVDSATLGFAKQAILMMDPSSVEAFLLSFPQAQAQYQKDIKNYFIKTALPELVDLHEKNLVSLFAQAPAGDHEMESERSLSPTTEISDSLSQLTVSKGAEAEDSDSESDDEEDSDVVKIKDTLEEMMPDYQGEILKVWTENEHTELSSLLTSLLGNFRNQEIAVHELAIADRAIMAQTDQEERKVDSLILETGICFGFCLDYASKKLRGDEREITERTGKKRFYQALHDVSDLPRWRDDAREVELKKIEAAAHELDQLFSGKESSIYEKCKKVYEVVLLQAAAVGDFVLKRKLEKELKEFKQVQKPASQCRLKLHELLKKQRELNAILEAQKKAIEHGQIDEKILKQLGFSLSSRDIDPTVKATEDFASLKRLIQEIGTEHAIFTFAEEKKDDEQSPFTTELYHKIAQIAGLEPKEDSKELVAQIQSIPKEQLKAAVDTFKAKELERYIETVAKRRLGENAPDLVLYGVKKKLTDECDEAISNLLGEKEDEDEFTNKHAVYLHVKPPYSLKDPNYPTLEFETDDLATFLIYIGIWSAISGNTHITRIRSITER